MKGIILAGGTGSRLFPLTKVTNKHLLPVGKKPMIFYPISKLVEAGITQIMIITGIEHMGAVVSLLGDGGELGCELTYRVQSKAGGIAQALGLARDFSRGENIAVILGDNIFQDSIKEAVCGFSGGGHVLLKAVHDPSRYGVAEVNGDHIINIIEKPAKPTSNLAVTGVYLYDENVFNIIDTLVPSKRGELEITDVNSEYLRRKELRWGLMAGWWTDAGTFESLAVANQLVQQ